MKRALMIAAVMCACAATAKPKDQLPPDPADPSTWGEIEPLPVETPDAGDAFAQIAARAAERAITTQRIARVKGEMLASIETDGKGNKTAKILHEDGTVEMRKLKVMHTARILPKKPEKKEQPLDASDAASAAAGIALGAAAALAAKKASAAGAAGPAKGAGVSVETVP
jgi:hypothetical protein